jgi:hypothetical protein
MKLDVCPDSCWNVMFKNQTAIAIGVEILHFVQILKSEISTFLTMSALIIACSWNSGNVST